MVVPIYRKATVLRRQSGSFPCRLTEIPVPVWSCLLPSCPTSDDPQSLNAAGMQRAVLLHLNLFPLYCLVLSCLIHLAPPLHLHPHPRPPHRLTHCSPSPLFGLGPVRLCNVHHSLLVPYPASLPVLPVLPACPPCLRLALCVLYIDTSGYSVSTVRTVPCHPAGCRNRIAGIIPQEYFTHWMTAQRVDA